MGDLAACTPLTHPRRARPRRPQAAPKSQGAKTTEELEFERHCTFKPRIKRRAGLGTGSTEGGDGGAEGGAEAAQSLEEEGSATGSTATMLKPKGYVGHLMRVRNARQVRQRFRAGG